jgi:hypothetical protein
MRRLIESAKHFPWGLEPTELKETMGPELPLIANPSGHVNWGGGRPAASGEQVSCSCSVP